MRLKQQSIHEHVVELHPHILGDKESNKKKTKNKSIKRRFLRIAIHIIESSIELVLFGRSDKAAGTDWENFKQLY